MARSEEQLNNNPKPIIVGNYGNYVEQLRPVGILTDRSGSPPPPPRPGSALGIGYQSRDHSQESTGHITKIKIEDNDDEEPSRRERKDRSDSR